MECGTPLSGEAKPVATSVAFQRYAPLLVVATVLVAGASAVIVGSQNATEAPRVPPHTQPASRAEGQMPEGHPPIALPDSAREMIRKKAEEVAAHPDDVAARKQLGLMQYRAGLIEAPFLTEAVKTYEAVLAKDPNDVDGLRALGDISGDADQQDKALEYYQRLLKLKPDDQYVLTLVGNIQLGAHNAADAVKSYEAALAVDPMLFQAQVGLGFGYAATGEPAKALDALQRARGLATDDATRKQVDDILARVGAPRPAAGGVGAAAGPAVAANAGQVAANDAGSFRPAVEGIFRSHPIVGPKLDRIDWVDDHTIKVALREFPMDQMPPFARDKFTERIKTGLHDSKARYSMSGNVTVQLVDSASGRVMDTIVE